MRVVAYIGGNGPQIPPRCVTYTESEFRDLVESYGGDRTKNLDDLVKFMTFETPYFEYSGVFELRSDQRSLNLNCE